MLKIPLDDPYFDKVSDVQLLWYSENFSIDHSDSIDKLEYAMSFVNGEAVEKARIFRKGGDLKTSEDVEEIFKNKDRQKELFDDPLVKSIGEALKNNNTNNKDNNITNYDLQSPLHKVIRDKK